MFVQRDEGGNIVGIFANPQPGIADDWVEGAEIYRPGPTYQQELEELNAAWQQQVDVYNRAFAVAALSDGPQEESKKLAIRADYEAARLQNTAARAALKTKYGM